MQEPGKASPDTEVDLLRCELAFAFPVRAEAERLASLMTRVESDSTPARGRYSTPQAAARRRSRSGVWRLWPFRVPTER
jgi:hypothetical protein